MKNTELISKAALELAFEAGKWIGQVELEEHYDREQYANVCKEAIMSRKMCMPIAPNSTGKTVTINLRSDKWREGVRNSALEYLKKAEDMLIQNIA